VIGAVVRKYCKYKSFRTFSTNSSPSWARKNAIICSLAKDVLLLALEMIVMGVTTTNKSIVIDTSTSTKLKARWS
jgi:hypothetical protein